MQVSGAAPAANCALEFAAANSAPVHTFYNNLSGGSIRIPMAGRGVQERSPFGRREITCSGFEDISLRAL